MEFEIVLKGDYPGHPFRGNQWGSAADRSSRNMSGGRETGVRSSTGTIPVGSGSQHIAAATARDEAATKLGGVPGNKLSHVHPDDVEWAKSQRGNPIIATQDERDALYGSTPTECGNWMADRFPTLDRDNQVFQFEESEARFVDTLTTGSSPIMTVEEAKSAHHSMVTGHCQAMDEMSALYPGAFKTLGTSLWCPDPEEIGRYVEPVKETQTYGWAFVSDNGSMGAWPGEFSVATGICPLTHVYGVTARHIISTQGHGVGDPFRASVPIAGGKKSTSDANMAYAASVYSTTIHEVGHIVDYHRYAYDRKGTAQTAAESKRQLYVGETGIGSSAGMLSDSPTSVQSRDRRMIEPTFSSAPSTYARKNPAEFRAESWTAAWMGMDANGQPPSETAIAIARRLERVGSTGKFDLVGTGIIAKVKDYADGLISEEDGPIVDNFEVDSVVVAVIPMLMLASNASSRSRFSN